MITLFAFAAGAAVGVIFGPQLKTAVRAVAAKLKH